MLAMGTLTMTHSMCRFFFPERSFSKILLWCLLCVNALKYSPHIHSSLWTGAAFSRTRTDWLVWIKHGQSRAALWRGVWWDEDIGVKKSCTWFLWTHHYWEAEKEDIWAWDFSGQHFSSWLGIKTWGTWNWRLVSVWINYPGLTIYALKFA